MFPHPSERASQGHEPPTALPDLPELRLRARLNALPLAARAELLHVLRLPERERADRIGELWSHPESRAVAELLIDCEEDRAVRAMLVGILREIQRGRQS